MIKNRQNLAGVLTSVPGLVLILLRGTEDRRTGEKLEVELPPQDGKAAGLSESEMALAKQLVEELSGPWNPAGFVDTFKRDIMALVERKASQSQVPTEPSPNPQPDASDKVAKSKTPAPTAAAKKRPHSNSHKA